MEFQSDPPGQLEVLIQTKPIMPENKVQFNARISPQRKREFKMESVRGHELSIDLMTEVLIVKFFQEFPTPEDRDRYWSMNRHLVEAPQPQPAEAEVPAPAVAG